jgi:hypothetical protein
VELFPVDVAVFYQLLDPSLLLRKAALIGLELDKNDAIFLELYAINRAPQKAKLLRIVRILAEQGKPLFRDAPIGRGKALTMEFLFLKQGMEMAKACLWNQSCS